MKEMLAQTLLESGRNKTLPIQAYEKETVAALRLASRYGQEIPIRLFDYRLSSLYLFRNKNGDHFFHLLGH